MGAKVRGWLDSLKTGLGTLAAHLRTRLDAHAEKDKQGWAASMEYKRRYTNPDEAKRNRTPPDARKPDA